MKTKLTDYDKVIETLFREKCKGKSGNELAVIDFNKDEVVAIAKKLRITIRNVPDIVYTYRSRSSLPDSIRAKGNWFIQPKGKGKFAFVRTKRDPFIQIQEGLASIEILNALPEIVEKYTAYDEQGLLSTIRYNRLVDVFTEITCFHLQSHIRTTVKGGQIEVDDLYIGIDQDGVTYILPLEAKSPDERDKLNWVQASNMVLYARQKFPHLICRPLAAKPIDRNRIYLMEFENNPDFEKIKIKNIRLYKLFRGKKQSALDNNHMPNKL